jgi:hypothetical protein
MSVPFGPGTLPLSEWMLLEPWQTMNLIEGTS